MKTANPPASLTGSHRRAQPVRQTRVNPPRASIPRAGPGARNGHGGHESESGPIHPSAFFPAITHFTDSISALPREVIRHFSLLKEVDSKIYGPEETLAQLTDLGLRTPLPALRQIVTNGAVVEARKDDRAVAVVEGVAVAQSKDVVISDHGSITTSEPPTQFEVNEASDTTRRHIFLNLRYVLSEMMMTIDEKNHVIATANEALQKQLARMDSSYPYIENEISEEARLGSLRHWAYNDKSLSRINNASGPADRSRRDIAAANSLAAAAAAMEEVPAPKADKRDAAPAKRSRKPAQIESDVDDEHLGRPRDIGAALTSNPTPAPRKSHAKVRKPAEPAVVGMGLGITNGPSALGNPPNKRRRTEKVSNGEMTGGVAMDRSISGAFSNHAHVGKGKAGSPRETPVAEGGRKRNRGGNGGNGGVSSTIIRKRVNTSSATIQSSSIASSPIQSTFPPTNDSHRAPTEHPLPRPQSSRARKNSAQSLPQDNGATTARQSSVSATSGRPPPDDCTSAIGPADLAAAGSSIGRSVPEVKSLPKESSTTQGERLSEEHQHSREDDHKGTLVIVTSTNGEKAKEGAAAPKCEETVNQTIAVPHGQSSHGIRNTTITTNSRKASKQSTPVTATFTEKNRQSRPSRAQGTVANTNNAEHAGSMKRSHKKGAGAAAAQQQQHFQQMQQQQQQALQLDHVTSTTPTPGTRDEEAGSIQGDEEDEEDEDTSGQRYCFCNQVSYGEMVACDADGCRVEWFHLGCVGLAKAPTKNAKWYCDECKEKLPNGRVHGGGGR